MMNRTTIMLPSSLKLMVDRLAKANGVSLGEYIREALMMKLNLAKQKEAQIRDPFYAEDIVFSGKTPGDLAMRHDDYLYE